MAILSTQQLGQSFGAFDVFMNVNVTLQPGAKVGLVGPNGIGKTSLLLLLCGLDQPAAGRVTLKEGVRLGYLRQEAMSAFHEAANTVWEEMMSVFAGVHVLEDRLAALETAMSEETDGAALEAILDEYGAVRQEFETLGGYDYEVRTKATLQGLGFSEDEYATPLRQLSGGQKTRALLARLLLARPDLLVLDEPTNHLDMGAVQWLERTLRQWSGALLIVSHDRYFLDAVVDTIWEMHRTGIDVYRGNYTAYLRQRQERQDYAEKVYQQEMERLRGELDYIKRNIARASTNGGAVGRLRRLSRDLAAIDEIGVMDYKASRKWSETGVGGVRMFTVAEAEAAIKAIPSPVKRLPRFAVRLKPVYRSGDYVLRTRDLQVGYPTRSLFRAGEIVLMRRECAALIGDNGTGKTTLLKTLTGEIAPLSGQITLGAGLKVGYFAQAHEQMNLDNTVLDELMRHKAMRISEARDHLAQLLFRADDVYKKVGMLSGGERGKLALAILTLNNANLLLLDEPTNHLDIQAQEILQEALEQFEGTILLVSHDRYLIDRLATQIWELEDGTLRVFKGGYQEFLAAEKADAAGTPAPTAPPSLPRAPRPRKNPALARLEMQIHSVETALKELDLLLERASAAQKSSAVESLGRQYAEQQAALEDLLARWMALAEAADEPVA
ncbi:MAG: ABC-F family ATP-binding cassette domain-containing protein [Anaerolineae bacterium]|nr:ABC-F family ATP-binding cassette domain-containing protein [Anaerolineae bacterium]